MKALILLLLTLLNTLCNTQAKSNIQLKQPPTKWSVRMANSVMKQADSLIHYVPGKPKWAYDVAFLGMAIDRLGNIDRKYSKYMGIGLIIL